MPRFARMLKSAYESKGHDVTVWSPPAKLHRLFKGTKLAKWAGYIDQYFFFPFQARKSLKSVPPDTVFVFCDQALGPWVPLVKERPHVVHVHDLLALRSALGDIEENPTSWTGRIYQRYIRRGFKHARHFISVSQKTHDDLQEFGQVTPVSSDVVYNSLNYPYSPLEPRVAQQILEEGGFPVSPNGFLLHLGGNQWYKNQRGLLALYGQYAELEQSPLPLYCVSPKPTSAEALLALSTLNPKGRVVFLQNVSNRTLQAAYSSAKAFLFPSLEEGFGWPLIEAQACGCPVLTTRERPMTEVAGPEAFYISRLRMSDDIRTWAAAGAATLRDLLAESEEQARLRSQRGVRWANDFDPERSIHQYLHIYGRVLSGFSAFSAPGVALDEGRES
jgi:glycosyltransferase involved in cell wall biosynthesis